MTTAAIVPVLNLKSVQIRGNTTAAGGKGKISKKTRAKGSVFHLLAALLFYLECRDAMISLKAKIPTGNIVEVILGLHNNESAF